MIRNILCVIALILAISGCTSKEFEDGAHGMGNDVKELFKVRE